MAEHRRPIFGVVFVLAALFSTAALADDTTYVFTIKGHRLSPETLKVPAGRRVQLTVHNRDSSPEEFESHDLRRERIVPGGSTGQVWVGPLPEGRYKVFGDFHPNEVHGWVVAE